MISEKQLQANLRNAPKSTAPQNAEGKAAFSQNALRHVLAELRRLQSIRIRNEAICEEPESPKIPNEPISALIADAE